MRELQFMNKAKRAGIEWACSIFRNRVFSAAFVVGSPYLIIFYCSKLFMGPGCVRCLVQIVEFFLSDNNRIKIGT